MKEKLPNTAPVLLRPAAPLTGGRFLQGPQASLRLGRQNGADDTYCVSRLSLQPMLDKPTRFPPSAEPQPTTAPQSSACAPTAGCLFSGMGGFASGLAASGFTVLWASDNNADACAAFSHRHPGVRVLQRDVQDLRVDADGLTPVDVLTAGFPCQSFSQAGGRMGFDDDRGKAFFQIPRLLSEFTPQRRPKFLILENVEYILYGNDGRWFDTIQRELRQVGYWFRRQSCWQVNVKDATTIPQDRSRVFLVAASREHYSHNPFKPPIIQATRAADVNSFLDRSKRANDDDYLPKDNKYCKMIESKISEGESSKNLYQLRRSYVREKRGKQCPTLTANMGIGGHNVPFIKDSWGIRRLTVEEIARLQGFDTSISLFPDLTPQAQYRLLGNAVCPELARLVAKECFPHLTLGEEM